MKKETKIKTKEQLIKETVKELKPFFDKPIVKLDAGAGHHQIPPSEDGIEWIHQDGCFTDGIELVCKWDDIPLPNKSIDELHFSDAVEHIPMWELDKTMGELNRIMKVGAKIWGNTPNAHGTMKRFGSGELSFKDAMLNMYGWADHPYQTHYMTYTHETLTVMMEKYGFGNADYSKSPSHEGDHLNAWWLVFEFTKLKDI